MKKSMSVHLTFSFCYSECLKTNYYKKILERKQNINIFIKKQLPECAPKTF